MKLIPSNLERHPSVVEVFVFVLSDPQYHGCMHGNTFLTEFIGAGKFNSGDSGKEASHPGRTEKQYFRLLNVTETGLGSGRMRLDDDNMIGLHCTFSEINLHNVEAASTAY